MLLGTELNVSLLKISKINRFNRFRSSNLIQQASTYYEQATNDAEEAKGLPSFNPVRLGVALNFAVFEYKVKRNAKKAIEIAHQAFRKAIEELTGNEDEELYKESLTMLEILRENISRW